jgi:uncharacterized protein YnzC (UPF0291/DUF896 family)
MRSQKEERDRKMGDLTRANSKKYFHSKALRDQLELDHQAKIEHLEKKNEIMDRYASQKEYAEMVRTKIRPQMTVKDEDRVIDKNTALASASLSEQHKMGNDYMKQVH